MTAISGWLRQPSTVIALAVIAGAALYWLTGSTEIAAIAFAAVAGGISDNTAQVKDASGLLARIEQVEDRFRQRVPAALLALGLAASLGLTACGASSGQSGPPTLPIVQASAAAISAAVDAERANILKAVKPDQVAATTAVIDGVDAAAAGIAAIDPTKATADQVVAALQKFIDASGPLQADLPLSPTAKASIAIGLPVVKALLPYVPQMFPPKPAPAPAPVPVPAPVPTPVQDAPKVGS